jgi:TatD DNase family protein
MTEREMQVSRPGLIDCHLHLQDDCFAADLPAVLARARAAGVGLMVCNGASQADWPTVLSLAKSYPDIIPCFGVHPWYAQACEPHWLAELKHFLTVVPSAAGETGLDRFIEPRNEKVQEEVFRAQLWLAEELHHPITIHCVQAWGWMMEVLASQRTLPEKMLFHSYSGSAELIKPLAAMGGYFSYAGGVLREKAVKRREALAATPIDRLMLETDSPDIIPPRRFCVAADGVTSEGKPRNEPANMAGVVRGTADVLHIGAEELSLQLHENAERFFAGLIPSDL